MAKIRWKVITIVAVFILFSVVGVYPILATRYNLPSPRWVQDKQLKLGLDLKGGVHLVLRVETDDALKGETDTEMERLRETLQNNKIAVTGLTAVSPTQFRVDGVPSAQDAAFRQASTEVQTNFERGSNVNGSYTFTMKPNVAQNLAAEAVVQARQTIERRVTSSASPSR